jgi:3-phosphoinositide dependent protein kinase-1
MHAKITDFGTAKIKKADANDTDDEVKGPNVSRQTFCGTAEYVSPEVLNNQPVNEAADLWALGCMVYHFFTGHCPFKGESQYLIFQKILKREFDYPPDFPETAKDLVDNLLRIDPNDRLGVGQDGYKKLKAHPFFEGIDFTNLPNMTPPSIVPKELMAASNGQSNENERWSIFLLKNEQVFHSKLVIKRRRLTAKKRQLIITDRPRILYVDPDSMQLKGIVPWSRQLWIQKRTDKDFIIHTPGRKYVLESLDNDVDGWVNAIESLQKR